MRGPAALLLLAACEAFELAPIELDVSTNCNEVEVLTIAAGIQSSARPWHTIVAAAVDRAAGASAWLLVVRSVDGGLDQLALVHVDEALQVDHDIVVDLPVGFADQLELVAADTVGVVYLTQRAPGTFYVRRYDASLASPLSASTANLATIFPPCDIDGNEIPDTCDASSWFQDLVFFGDDPSMPYALTFPPMSGDASVDVTPTALREYLQVYPLDNERTLDFSPACDDSLPLEELEDCESFLASLTFPVLESAGLARDAEAGIVALALYREVKVGDDPVTVADLPLVLLGLNEFQEPSGFLRVEPSLPEPRNTAPRGVTFDTSAAYVLYTAVDDSSVLVRAAHSAPTLERLDDLDIADDMTMLQLDEDIALHHIVDGAWEILKLFPDAPRRSVTTVHAPDAAVEAVIPAGRSSFVVRTADGDADLVQVRCAAATIP